MHDSTRPTCTSSTCNLSLSVSTGRLAAQFIEHSLSADVSGRVPDVQQHEDHNVTTCTAKTHSPLQCKERSR